MGAVTERARSSKPLTSNPAIIIRDLHKSYAKVKALTGLDLEIEEGEIFGLIGPDGAGKTTAFNILAGVLGADDGEAMVLGKSSRQIRGSLGYVTQNFSLYPILTIDENLRYFAGLNSVEPGDFERRRERLLKQMGLIKFADRKAENLSGGMKQKLALCCALVSEPKALLLDEPSNGIDPLSRRELWQTLEEVREQGITVVLATPYLDEAERCDRVALLYEGRARQVGTPAELAKSIAATRIEVEGDDAGERERSEEMRKSLKQECPDFLLDVYTIGNRLNLVVKNDRGSGDAALEFLATHRLDSKKTSKLDPNLENVFVTRLKELGLQDDDPPPLPRQAMGKNEDRRNQTAIETESLGKNFDGFEAVKNLDLHIEYGQVFGLLGANGSGKTTTIKMLCGLLKPSSGKVEVAGEGKNLRSKRLRAKIGYMSQKITLYDTLTTLENLEFYAMIYNIEPRRRQEKIDWAINACGLAEMRDVLIKQLPRGWKQRIAFGAAAMHEPEILILDEPTAGVDPIARRQIWTLIRDFARNGAAVLVTTHYMDEAEYCNQLAFMSRGSIIASGSLNDLKDGESLEERFVAIMKSHRHEEEKESDGAGAVEIEK